MKHYCIIALSVLAFACQQNKPMQNTKALARVDDHFLYLSDLLDALPSGLHGNDSIAFANNYIDKWVRSKLMFEKAQEKLGSVGDDIDRKVEDYKESLYIFEFEQQLINRKLNKDIPASEVEAYYSEHKHEMQLTQSIVQPVYIKYNKDEPRLQILKRWLSSRKQEELDSLKDYSYQHAHTCFFAEKWIDRAKFMSEIPIKNPYIEMRADFSTVLNDEAFLYFIRIMDYREIGDIAPLEYVQDEIREILLQKRAKQFVIDTRNKLYDEALKDSRFELFENKK